MYLEEVLTRVGGSALDAFLCQGEWIHRRVESVTFPARNDPIVRRRVSIDFTIPEGLQRPDPDMDGTSEGLFYVPLSVLRKWPPVLQLDLRTEQDEPIPLLTRNQNGTADKALLVALAERAAGKEAIEDTGILEHLRTIAERPGNEARQALTVVIPPDPADDDDPRAALRKDPAFLDLAGGLVDNTLLWLRISGKTGDRKLVKFAYDVARDLNVTLFDRAAFGLEPLQATVETPHIGSAGSYHLAVASPAPLDIIDAKLSLRRRATPLHNVNEGDVVAECTAAESRTREGPLELSDDMTDVRLYADAVGRQARFYIAGSREGCFGELKISIAVEKGGFLRSAAIAGSMIALLLLMYAVGFVALDDHPERLTPVLLLVPGLLAYLVVRPNDHALARDFLSGTRWLLLASGLLAIGGAGTLAVGGTRGWVHAVAWVIAVLATLIAVALWAGVVLPRKEDQMPLSED